MIADYKQITNFAINKIYNRMYTLMKLVDHSFYVKTNSPRVLGGGKLDGGFSGLFTRIASFHSLFIYNKYTRSPHGDCALLSCPVVSKRKRQGMFILPMCQCDMIIKQSFLNITNIYS